MFKTIGRVIQNWFSPAAPQSAVASPASCGQGPADSAQESSQQQRAGTVGSDIQQAQVDPSEGPFGRALRVIRRGMAMRVIFFYPGEEGTYVDHAEVILYENGMVHIFSNQEETTTHLQNCEILWRFETDAEDRANKVRLLKPEKKPEKKSDKKGNSPTLMGNSGFKGGESGPVKDARGGLVGSERDFGEVASLRLSAESTSGESTEEEAEECFEKGPAPTLPPV
jgi:hypothetical protein